MAAREGQKAKGGLEGPPFRRNQESDQFWERAATWKLWNEGEMQVGNEPQMQPDADWGQARILEQPKTPGVRERRLGTAAMMWGSACWFVTFPCENELLS